MPATITSTGTWTALSTDLTNFRMASQSTTAANTASMNTPQVGALISADFSNAGKINVPEEVFRVIELMQFGFGGQTQATRLAFWPTAALLRAFLNALFTGQASTDPTTYPAPARAQADAN